MSEQYGNQPPKAGLHQDALADRRPYHTPELQDFGSVGSLTQNNLTYVGSDGVFYS
jgi:hypothetical protein